MAERTCAKALGAEGSVADIRETMLAKVSPWNFGREGKRAACREHKRL